MKNLRKRFATWLLAFHDYAFQRQVGRISLLFYRLLYSAFEYGANLTAWGWSIVRIYWNGSITLGDDCVIISSVSRIESVNCCKLVVRGHRFDSV